MTRNSIREYAEAVRNRYLKASKKDKTLMLDEFCRTTGYHRKSAIRLLRHPSSGSPSNGGISRGRKAKYGKAIVQPLKTLWEASDRLCSKRLTPFIPELLAALERHGEIKLEPQVREQLLGISAATIDRRLKPLRNKDVRRPYSQSRSSSALKAQIPIRTFTEWTNVTPGSAQADLVLHCGESTEGLYLTTLVVVDVATGWTECQPIWGKGQQRVGTGMHLVRRRLPFALKELHTDNGGEFLNEVLYPWCKREGIHLSRGRPYKKNDQAYSEQKNWSVVCRLVGYDRYSTKEALEQMHKLYGLLMSTLEANEHLLEIAQAAGGEAGARIANSEGLCVSPDTLLRLLRNSPSPAVSAPRVLGVDDFALRRRQKYGTIFLDLESRRPVDMVEGREADVLADWLKAHPGVEVIARDRSGAYAEGAKIGAPGAIQVADRFHSLKNASAALDGMLRGRRLGIEEIDKTEATKALPTSALTVEGHVQETPAQLSALRTPHKAESTTERYLAERRAARIARWKDVRALAEAGIGIHEIARRVGICRNTVRRLIATPEPPRNKVGNRRPGV